MPETLRKDARAVTEIFTIRQVTGRSVMRLKVLSPAASRGDTSVAFAGQLFPAKVGTTVAGAVRMLCTGPGEWLLSSQDHSPADLRAALESEPARPGLVLVDLSSGLAVLAIDGSAARETLAQACGLDLDERVFGSGRCARTRLAQVAVLIDVIQQPNQLELYVARSHAHYLETWLLDAAAERGHGADVSP